MIFSFSDQRFISKRLEYSFFDITQAIYSHVLPQRQDQAAKEINAMLTPKTDTLGTL